MLRKMVITCALVSAAGCASADRAATSDLASASGGTAAPNCNELTGLDRMNCLDRAAAPNGVQRGGAIGGFGGGPGGGGGGRNQTMTQKR